MADSCLQFIETLLKFCHHCEVASSTTISSLGKEQLLCIFNISQNINAESLDTFISFCCSAAVTHFDFAEAIKIRIPQLMGLTKKQEIENALTLLETATQDYCDLAKANRQKQKSKRNMESLGALEQTIKTNIEEIVNSTTDPALFDWSSPNYTKFDLKSFEEVFSSMPPSSLSKNPKIQELRNTMYDQVKTMYEMLQRVSSKVVDSENMTMTITTHLLEAPFFKAVTAVVDFLTTKLLPVLSSQGIPPNLIQHEKAVIQATITHAVINVRLAASLTAVLNNHLTSLDDAAISPNPPTPMTPHIDREKDGSHFITRSLSELILLLSSLDRLIPVNC